MNKYEFSSRRRELMDMIGKGSIAILPTAPQRIRNRDALYPYRADSDFYYLTGFPEPEAVAVLIPERSQGEYLLFCRERNPEKETWDGRRAGLEGACELYGADDAFPITDLDDILPGLLENCQRIYYPMGVYADFDSQVVGWINQLRERSRAGVHAPSALVSLDHLLHDMRLYKSDAELDLMRRAAEISVNAHKRAMQTCRAGMYEYQLEAEILYEFNRGGSRAPAYASIVGGGENGCILHYVENNCVLKDGDLVLIDAGAEFENYAADITRTFPVNGRFSPAQKQVYEIVLAAQAAAIATIRPNVAWNAPHEAAVRVLTAGLREMGLLSGDLETLISEESYKRFYMHRTGHWLGMDVHDVGDYKIEAEWRLLEPGMVMTVEPGLYIPASPDVDPRWWNIGIRIEDDILVTAEGCEVLTAAMPKTVVEIEQLMAGE